MAGKVKLADAHRHLFDWCAPQRLSMAGSGEEKSTIIVLDVDGSQTVSNDA